MLFTKILNKANVQNVSILKKGQNELLKGIKDFYFWTYLGWSDIRQRYRRSMIGPFWVTLSTAIFILAIGIVYSRLFKMNMQEYLPFLAAGYIAWFFISSVAIESCSAFIEAAPFIKEVNLPLSIFTFRILWRNVLVYAHNFLVILGLLIFFGINPGLKVFDFLLGFFLVVLNLGWVSLILSFLGSRFRDVLQIVQSLIQVLFFISPVAWMPKLVGENSLIIKLNPINYFIEVMRGPLLGKIPSLDTWLIMLLFALIGWFLALTLFSKFHKRVVFWL